MNTPSAEQSPKKTLRPGFFEEAFRDSALTPPLRTFAEAFCMRFDVRGRGHAEIKENQDIRSVTL